MLVHGKVGTSNLGQLLAFGESLRIMPGKLGLEEGLWFGNAAHFVI